MWHCGLNRRSLLGGEHRHGQCHQLVLGQLVVSVMGRDRRRQQVFIRLGALPFDQIGHEAGQAMKPAIRISGSRSSLPIKASVHLPNVSRSSNGTP